MRDINIVTVTRYFTIQSSFNDVKRSKIMFITDKYWPLSRKSKIKINKININNEIDNIKIYNLPLLLLLLLL